MKNHSFTHGNVDHQDHDHQDHDHRDNDHQDYDHQDHDHQDYDHRDHDHLDYDYRDHDHPPPPTHTSVLRVNQLCGHVSGFSLGFLPAFIYKWLGNGPKWTRLATLTNGMLKVFTL